MVIGMVYFRLVRFMGVFFYILFIYIIEVVFLECDWGMEEIFFFSVLLVLGFRLRLGGNCLVVLVG